MHNRYVEVKCQRDHLLNCSTSIMQPETLESSSALDFAARILLKISACFLSLHNLNPLSGDNSTYIGVPKKLVNKI
jgi:hypothetical protein